MSERWARALLASYRWAGAMVYPVVGAYVAARTRKGKEEKSRRNERYGQASAPRPDGPLVWVHAASVGETSAVIPLIERIVATGIHVVLTTGTVTSAKLVEERLNGKVRVGLKHAEVEETLPLAPAKPLRFFTVRKLQRALGEAANEETLQAALGLYSDAIVRREGLRQVADEGAIGQVIADVVAAHPSVVEDYRRGKKQAAGFLVGQVMKATHGKANPQVVNRLLAERLGAS